MLSRTAILLGCGLAFSLGHPLPDREPAVVPLSAAVSPAPIASFAGALAPTVPLSAPAVQLFDVVQGRVIRTAPNSLAFRRLGESWIASIRGAWQGFRLDPESGYILKIPFEPAVRVNSGWYRGEVRELYVMWDPLTPHDTRMMLMGPEGKPRMFYVKSDAGSFVEKFKEGQRVLTMPGM